MQKANRAAEGTSIQIVASAPDWHLTTSVAPRHVSRDCRRVLGTTILLCGIGAASCAGTTSLLSIEERLRTPTPCDSEESCDQLAISARAYLDACEKSTPGSCSHELSIMRRAKVAVYRERRQRMLERCQNGSSDDACITLRRWAEAASDSETEAIACEIACSKNDESICCRYVPGRRKVEVAEQPPNHGQEQAPQQPPEASTEPRYSDCGNENYRAFAQGASLESGNLDQRAGKPIPAWQSDDVEFVRTICHAWETPREGARRIRSMLMPDFPDRMDERCVAPLQLQIVEKCRVALPMADAAEAAMAKARADATEARRKACQARMDKILPKIDRENRREAPIKNGVCYQTCLGVGTPDWQCFDRCKPAGYVSQFGDEIASEWLWLSQNCHCRQGKCD